MQSREGGLTTSKLLTMIRGADTFEEATAYHRSAKEPVFSDALYDLMQQKGLSARDMILRSGIERSYFYHILSGGKTPGRNMVLRIGFCLPCTLPEMNQLLRLAGLSGLYARIRRDAALIFAIQHRYTMEQANDLILQAGEEPMYK